MSMSLPDEAIVPKYFRFASIRAEVRTLRRFTRALRWIAMIWAGLFSLNVAWGIVQRWL